MTKSNKGITLIALIITIVVLLIIAVVAIGAVNNTGIIGHAQNAAAEEEPENTPSVVETDMPVATIGTKVEVKSTINGENYNSSNPVIPAGFAPVNVTIEGQESSWTAEGGPEVSKGLVITDAVDENGNSTGSEFVWIPVQNINEIVMCKTHGTSKTIDQETLQCPECGANTQLVGIVNNRTTYSETSYREPGIVTKVYNSETSTYDKDGVDKDFTLLTQKAKITDRVQKEGETSGTVNEYDLLDQLENEFNSMVASVAEYGGFYVGRYETSLDGTKAQSMAGVKTATAAGSNEIENIDTWYGLYKISQTYTARGVTSEMIWGCQYDAVMRFIGTEKANAAGNVSHTPSDFTTMPYMTGGIDYSTNYTKKEGQKGYVPYKDIASNIYDLEGNVRELTKEADDTIYRVARGGSCWDRGSIGLRSYYYPTITGSNVGSRLTLYVEL